MLDGVVLILRNGVHPQHCADIGAVEPLGRALRDLVSTLTGPFISPVQEPAALPGLYDLAAAGLPVADADTYADAVAACRDHRIRLWGWCVSDG